MMWIKISLENVRPIVVVNIYRPPQGNYKKCCEIISDAFDKADLKDNTDIFLMGDFNINFKSKATPEYRELDFTTRSLGLRQLITSPTRITFREGTIIENTIDLLFSNSEHIVTAKTLDFNISDHLGIMVSRKKTPIKSNKIDFKGRSYRNYVKEEFQQKLIDTDWYEFYNNNDPNWLWEFMYQTILRNIESMCPMKSFKVSEFREVWMTNEAVEAIKDKDQALNKARRTKREEDWVQAKRLRNRVGRDIENLRADYNRKCIKLKKGNQGRVWLKNKKGEDVEYENTAGFINSFFTNIGPELAKQHRAEWKYYGETVPDSIGEITTDLGEVMKFCKEIEVMKASGMDKISAKICKDSFLVLGQQLTYLFNCSLNTAVFPEKWKVAKVIPLFKGGDREAVGNYRPVSLLPLPGKLLEK